MPRRSRSRSLGKRRESRSPILRRRRSEHDRGGGRGGGGRERRRGSQDPPMRHNSDRPGDRNTQNQRIMGGRSEGARHMWQNDVHPSRALDLNQESEMEESSAKRTDRFATERFKKMNVVRYFEGGRGMEEGRRGRGWRGGRRWERRSEGDGRGWRGEGEGGHGVVVGTRVEREGGEGVAKREVGEEMEGEEGRQVGGKRGRGGRRAAREREEMEKEEQVFREKRLMDSLTDPRDVPKGSWYFEHDDRESAQTTQPSRRYSTGDERYRRDRRGTRDLEREKWREGRERRGGERERERGYRQRSPQVWGHDMFEQLEREEAGEEGEGEGEWGQEGWEGEEQEVGSGRQQRRSVVHRLGTRQEDTRGDHHRPLQRDGGVDGTWAHDKFSEHDKLVSYPIQQRKAHQRAKERAREGEEVGKVFEKKKEQTDISMDTL